MGSQTVGLIYSKAGWSFDVLLLPRDFPNEDKIYQMNQSDPLFQGLIWKHRRNFPVDKMAKRSNCVWQTTEESYIIANNNVDPSPLLRSFCPSWLHSPWTLILFCLPLVAFPATQFLSLMHLGIPFLCWNCWSLSAEQSLFSEHCAKPLPHFTWTVCTNASWF